MGDPIVEATVEPAGSQSRSIAPCGFVPAGGVCRERRNLGSLRAAGIETELEIQPGRHWALQGSYLWNPTRILSAPENPELEGNAGSRTPEHALTLAVRYANPTALDASLSARWVGRRFEDDLNSLKLDPFVVLDGRLSRRVRQQLEVFLGVENLFDTEIITSRATSGLVRIGAPRTLLGGVRWHR